MLHTLLNLWTRCFILWVLIASAAAYAAPGLFLPFRGWIVPALGLVMFGMGITLLPADFARVAAMPRAVGCGILAQFLLMPLLGLALAKLGRLEPQLAMGMVIVGSCPGGTASNLIAWLARGDLALSVSMTACSTLSAVLLTPLLIWLYGGQFIPVDPMALLLDVLYVVLIPVTAGLLLRAWLGRRIERVLAIFPAISVLVIVLIIATIVAASRDRIIAAFGITGGLVLAHNLSGLALGYALAALWQLPPAARRTIAIEVGMQNSGLGAALAAKHFAPIVALPASIFSVVHNITGSLLATWWGRRPVADDVTTKLPGRAPPAPSSPA